MGSRNSRSKYQTENYGIRMTSMYVVEDFGWGFQLYDQENDDGIDGELIVRDKTGADTGVRIHCQIKSGPSYLKREDDNFLYLQPYSPKSKLKSKLETYSRFANPVILIYANTRLTTSNGNVINNNRLPFCWWVRLDNYTYDNTSYIRVPKTNRFGVHSKGDLLKLLKPIMKSWTNHPLIIPNKSEFRHFYSNNLLNDAKAFYKSICTRDGLQLGSSEIIVSITRIGWRHITKKSRGVQKVNISLKLLPIAYRMIREFNGELIMLRSIPTVYEWCKCYHYAIRARLNLPHEPELKVQVVFRTWENTQKGTKRMWLYSVHTIK